MTQNMTKTKTGLSRWLAHKQAKEFNELFGRFPYRPATVEEIWYSGRYAVRIESMGGGVHILDDQEEALANLGRIPHTERTRQL